MKFLLDTDTCSTHMRRPCEARQRRSETENAKPRSGQAEEELKKAAKMVKTTHGKVQGKTIELDEDLGVPEGQVVEVQVRAPNPPPMSEGLAKIYEILGRRHRSGDTDTAERHNEHQP